MQSRPAISASRAKQAMSGRAMPVGKGLGITTPMLTIEVLLRSAGARQRLSQSATRV